MGVVLPLLPKKIELQPNSDAFSNLVSVGSVYNRNTAAGAAALYAQAQQNLDAAQQQMVVLVSKLEDKKNALRTLVSTYGDVYQGYVDTWGVNAAIERLITQEKFGHGSSAIWSARVGDLHNYFENTAKIIPNEWDDPSSRWSIHGMGVAGNNPWRAAQIELVKFWAEQIYSKDKSSLEQEIKGLEKNILDKDAEIKSLTDKRDAALAAEQRASGQRIAERMADPVYVQAQAAAQEAILNAQTRQKTRTMLFAVVGLAILVGGAALIFKNR